MIGLIHFMVLSLGLFVIGVVGILINRGSLLSVLISINIATLGIIVSFCVFSSVHNNNIGYIATLLVLVTFIINLSVSFLFILFNSMQAENKLKEGD